MKLPEARFPTACREREFGDDKRCWRGLWRRWQELPAEPLHVVGKLATGYIAPESLHLDGILSAACLTLYASEIESARNPLVIPLPLAAAWVAPAGEPLWLATELRPLGSSVDGVKYLHSRYPTDRADLASRTAAPTAAGRWKDARLPLPVTLTPAVEGWCFGNRDTIMSLLERVTHVGRKAAHGQGRIVSWQIEQAPILTIDDVLERRDVPVEYLAVSGMPVEPARIAPCRGWTPPYWARGIAGRRQACAMDALTRAGYLAHAESDAYRRRLAETRAIVAAHPDYAVCTSWGKDSVAMLSVAAGVDPEIAVVYGRYRTCAEVFRDVDAARDAVLARPEMARVRYSETTIPGAWEIFERVGHAFVSPETPAQRQAVAWWKREFDAAMAKAADAAGSCGVHVGMRGLESKARRLNIAVRGTSYETGAGRATALPLAHWSGRDVWARLVSAGLPWLRIYDASPDRERARSDFCWAAGGSHKHLRDGVLLDWRRAYPDQVAAWIARWPELGRLADGDVGAVA